MSKGSLNSTMELLGVIDLQNPNCLKRIKQKQLCYAEKSPTDKPFNVTNPFNDLPVKE